MANVITLDVLIEKKACQDQVDLFKQHFGESVEITEEICLKYYDKFVIERVVVNMLNEEQREAYMVIQGPAWKDYKVIEEPAYEAYNAIVSPANEAYEAIQRPAYTKYLKNQARAFFVAYNS